MKAIIVLVLFLTACNNVVSKPEVPDLVLSDSGVLSDYTKSTDKISNDLSSNLTPDSTPDLTSDSTNLTPDTLNLIIDPAPDWAVDDNFQLIPNKAFKLEYFEFGGEKHIVSGNHYISFKYLGDRKYVEVISGSFSIGEEFYQCGYNQYEIEIDDNGYLVDSQLLKFNCVNEYRSKKIKYSFDGEKLTRYMFDACGCDPNVKYVYGLKGERK